MENSHIQWTTHTFNPWIGCTKVSAGCAHCYAEARDKRFADGVHWGNGAPRQRTSKANWREPLKWDRQAAETACGDCDPCLGGRSDQCALGIVRPRVFCASLADWLDDEVPIDWLGDLMLLIEATPHLDWLLLTKRPQNWLRRINDAGTASRLALGWSLGKIPESVWVGTSIENQACADERIPALLAIPAKIRFLSCEPLLGPVDLGMQSVNDASTKIHWLICGGESGGNARPFNCDWGRSIVAQCRAAGVVPFIKQLGSRPMEHIEDAYVGGEKICDACEVPMQLNDRKGGDMNEWPSELGVREFPK